MFHTDVSKQRWAHTANPLINDANYFISALAVSLTSQDINGLVIETNFYPIR